MLRRGKYSELNWIPEQMIDFLDKLYGSHQEVKNGVECAIAPPPWTRIVVFDEIECIVLLNGKTSLGVLIPGEYFVGKIEHAFILPLTSSDNKPNTRAVNIVSVGVDWRGACKIRTIRELAIKSVELSESIDHDEPEDMADTLIRHWRFGADAFNLPMLAYSDDPKDSEKECSLKRHRLEKMPDNLRTRLLAWIGVHLPPRFNCWNPCIAINNQDYVLIDFCRDFRDDGEVSFNWAIFVPLNVIEGFEKKHWYRM